MLTGDKDETAKSIGISCGLITDAQESVVFHITSLTTYDLLNEMTKITN